MLDRIYATSWSFRPGVYDMRLYVEGEIALALPGLDGLALVLNDATDTSGVEGMDFGCRFEIASDLSWALTFYDLSLTLRMDTALIVAMEDDGTGGFVETGQPYGVTLTGRSR